MMEVRRRPIGFGILALALVLFPAGAPAQQTGPNQADSDQPVSKDALPVLPVGPGRAIDQDRIAKLPPKWIEQLQEMSPTEQDQFLRNNERYRSLPPRQQTVIRQRLKAWNSLSDKKREAVLERQQIWEQLPSDQRRQVRESLLPRWQKLPVPRREAILGKLRALRGLDVTQRSGKLSDDEFLGDMNEDDRQMLRELSNLGVGQAPGPG
jgi:hypothetical protein